MSSTHQTPGFMLSCFIYKNGIVLEDSKQEVNAEKEACLLVSNLLAQFSLLIKYERMIVSVW